MGWRQQQTELTRQAIIDTFVELSTSGRPVTIADVVRHSGISSATIFRHFENRAALVTAAANRDVMLGLDPNLEAWGLSELAAHTRQIWQRMADNLAVAREATVSEAGRELRVARFEGFRPELIDALRRVGVGEARIDELVAAVSVLASAPAFLDLHDRQGLSVDEAVETVFWAIECLVTAAGGDPALFSSPIENSSQGGGKNHANEGT